MVSDQHSVLADTQAQVSELVLGRKKMLSEQLVYIHGVPRQKAKTLSGFLFKDIYMCTLLACGC